MSEIDAVDEAIIDTDPATVAGAIMDEAMGKSHWWHPSLEMERHGDISPAQVGGLVDIIVHGPRGPVRWTNRTSEVTENTVRVEMIAGAFRGEGIWTFEPVDGKTRVRYRWRAQPSAWFLKLFAPFIDIEQSHHKVMKVGFEGLNQYIKQLKLQPA